MALLLLTAFAAPAQPVITNAPGYVITWDGNNGDNPTSPNVPTNIASATQGAVAYASGQLGPQIGAAFHYVTNLNDGFYGNTKSWIGGTNDPTPWFAGIQLSNAGALTGIAWGRDNTGASQDRCLGTYTLQIATNASFTTNAAAWTTVGTITYNNSVAGFSPWLRHRYQVATTAGGQIVATGVRLLVPDSGLATGTDIDELELLGSAAINLAYWRMGENDPLAANGVTNTFTSSLLGGVLTLRSNAVYTSSVASAAAAKVGSSLALQFTTGRYATNVLATTLTDNFGLELWVKPDATNAIQCIAYNGDSGPNGWGLYLYQGKYQGLFGGLAFLTGPNAVLGVWAHLALVRNNGLTTLYVNGVPSATSPLTPGVPTGRFALAAQPQTLTNEFFAGALDEVRVFTFGPGKFSIGDLLLPILPPTVATAAATAVGLVSATLNGTVNPGNLPTAAWFEWGTTTNYGNFTDTNLFAATNITFALSNNLSGLAGGTTYHYRLTASNGLGVSLGADVRFLVPLFANVPIAGPQGVYFSSVAWGDYDNDGRLDFLLTGYTNNGDVSQLWRNTGSGFTNVPIADLLGVYYPSVAWGDYDNDGRLDFLLTGYNGNFVSQLWRNTGSGFTNVSIADLPGVTYPSVAWGDYDNDGRLDFLLTGAPNTSTEIFQLWHNNTPITNTPPTAPTGLALTATTGGAVLSWNSATDGQTPASGLTYNVRAGSAPGGIDLFAGHVNAANGFRRVPAIGNAMLRHTLPLPGLTNGQTVYWSVQAVDTAFAGGPFASETSFYSAIVTTTADNGAGSLRAAINNVASPKLVTFDPPLSGQTITLTSGQLTLANTMTIDASPLPGGIQISGNNSSRVFEILPGVTASLAGLTIQNGAVNGAGTAGSGGGLYNSGTLQLTNCTFTANSAIQSGGAMFTLGNLTATACTFSTNTSIRGAVNVANAVANFFECTFSGNTATSIGGGALNTSSSAASVSLNSCTVSGNQATGAAVGGGVHIISGSSVTITNCILAGNSCPTVGLENFDGNLIVSGQNLTNGTPLLAPLGNYGGPTQTMPPLPSSPAIDRATNGTSFTTDQRGQPRVVVAFADLGAVEGVFNQNYPLVNVTKLGGGSVQFAFTNLSGPSYRVLASTNVAAPINTWSNLGVPTESPAGTFQFTDLQAPNYPSRFYRVTTP